MDVLQQWSGWQRNAWSLWCHHLYHLH